MTRLYALLAMMFITLLPGCASLANKDTTAHVASKVAVQYATLKYIGKGQTADDQLNRAKRVKRAAGDALALASESVHSITVIEQEIRKRVDWTKMSMEDRILADTLISLAAAELRARAGDGVIPPEKTVGVREVLQWVISGAEMVGA